jgi:hypothetical protein
MNTEYCERTKVWLDVMGFKNLAAVRAKLAQLECDLATKTETISHLQEQVNAKPNFSDGPE